MCGIYFSNQRLQIEQIEEKLASMEHRGPDNRSFKFVNEVTLGHVRLSILDIDKRGNQPMQYRNLWISYNGEVYNYLELRDDLIEKGYGFDTTTDTEVILKAFHFWGKDFVSRLNGMFAFAIYDSKKKRTYCYRDRLGVKPFYYIHNTNHFELSSQLSSLSHSKQISKEGLNSYLLTGFIPSPFTIFSDVKKLAPGSLMVYDNQTHKLNLSTYWDIKKIPSKPNKDFEQNKKKLKHLLNDAIKIRLASDVPLGAFLSGGIDSSLICSLLVKELGVKDLRTFTLKNHDVAFDESSKAKQYATLLNTKHQTIPINANDLLEAIPLFIKAFDEPFADSSAIPTLLLSKKIKKHVSVVLSGDGGDESFLGYNHFFNFVVVNKILRIPHFIRKLLAPLVPFKWLTHKHEILRKIFLLEKSNDFIIETFVGGVDYLKKPSTVFLNEYSPYLEKSYNGIQKMADYTIKFWLENDSNVKVDRASMAHSLEVRSPFLDYRIIEFARSLPISHRFKLTNRKIILKKILASYIPEKLFKMPKKGFEIPLKMWINNELKEDIIDTLDQSFLETIPNFKTETFLESMKLHFNGQKDYTRHIWRLYVLALWTKK